jgi:purine-nucleoside phosphorylase
MAGYPNSTIYDRAGEAARFIASRTSLEPKIAVVLGSGLGGFASQLENPVAIPFGEIPHFMQPTAIGHSGRLVIGMLNGVPVAVMQGRLHAYEGYSSEEVTFPVRALGRYGVRTLIVTNAAGGIRESFTPGQLVLISDHINLTGRNPAFGPNDERFGLRFFDMTEAYSRHLRVVAQAAAQEEGYALDQGVYLGLLGPWVSMCSAYRALRTWRPAYRSNL